MTEQTIDLRPEIVNVDLYRGDAWSVHVTIKDADGNPLDLTGATIAAVIRERPNDATSTPLTITPDDLATGAFWVGQTEADASGYYDVQVTLGTPRTYVRGRLSLTDDITA